MDKSALVALSLTAQEGIVVVETAESTNIPVKSKTEVVATVISDINIIDKNSALIAPLGPDSNIDMLFTITVSWKLL